MPLAYCPECDTYYPRSRGGCKWCGTKPAAIPVSPWKIWAAIGAGVVVIALGVWQYRVYSASRTASDSAALAPETTAEAAESTPSQVPVSRADTVGGEEGDSLHEGVGKEESLKVRIAGGVTPPPGGAPAGGAPAAAVPGGGAPGAAGGAGAARAARPPTGAPLPGAPATRDRYSGPWTRAVAIEWVNVRVNPARDAEVAGVVTPGTAVQLGDLRMGWRRVRSAGVEGWADARFFAADTVVRR